MNLKIGYVGLTHLGINYAIASAIKGFNVVCYDEDISLVKDLTNKKIPFFEKNTKKYLIKKFNKLKFTNNLIDLKKCDLIFISPDVPTNSKGKSDLSKIKNLIKKIIKIINIKSDLIILSQVPPGFTETINWPKKRLYYQVETLIFSNALVRALNPERIIVGKGHVQLDKKYKYFLKKFRCPILDMDYKSAELTKISINIYLISTVTSTNLLSEISENIGANWRNITDALKLDKRIGKYAYLSPGLGISGGNLERDLRTFQNFLKFNKHYRSFSDNIIKISEIRKKWIYTKFSQFLKGSKKIFKIGILGLAYKEGTTSTKNSPSIFFIKEIVNKKKFKINVYDPKIKKIMNINKIKFHENIKSLIKDSEILIIATPWKIFKRIDLKNYKNIKYVIDPFNMMKLNKKIKNSFKYISMGK